MLISSIKSHTIHININLNTAFRPNPTVKYTDRVYNFSIHIDFRFFFYYLPFYLLTKLRHQTYDDIIYVDITVFTSLTYYHLFYRFCDIFSCHIKLSFVRSYMFNTKLLKLVHSTIRIYYEINLIDVQKHTIHIKIAIKVGKFGK